ncbi:hypothetical protein NG798_20290 [Ancylothrix sp. C2]|uniref:hypothetical protein n=1 Tax=Ancylothrix sp. D3o TaxID=2953691 RepID=UPI0021BB6CBD|nr:hypothetical protein [Ancylothrix sp. D3o]MCT7952140.1 hypothetical protein [Ancylothrix sp. D3o]
MMFSDFRSRYPTGCLISEFVTVDRAQYIVRVLVVVDGVTLSAALGAALSVEEAEEKARMRALAVLPVEWSSAAKTVPSEVGAGFVPTPAKVSPTPPITKQELISPPKATSFPTSWEPPKGVSSSVPVDDWLSETPESFSTSPNVLEIPPQVFEQVDEEPVYSGFSATEPVEVSPPLETSPLPSPTSKKEISEQLTKLIGKEIRRLGWTAQQGKDYLMQAFNKPSSKDLDENELLSFHLYLESLPDPEK